MSDYSSAGAAAGGLIGGPVGAGIGALAGGVFGLITGDSQKRKGRDLINQPYPTYEIPSEVTNAANQGLPSEQYALAMKNIQRNQMAAIQQAQDRRAGIGSVGKVQQLSNDAALKLDVENAKAKQQNQRILAGYKDKKWNWNVKDKYQRDYNYGMNLLGAGNVNTSTGIDKIGSGLGLLYGGGAFSGTGNGGSASGGSNGGFVDRTDFDTFQ